MSLVAYSKNDWYFDRTWTCIGKGDSDATCDNDAFVCGGEVDGAHFYGQNSEQIDLVYEASMSLDPPYTHPDCPASITEPKQSFLGQCVFRFSAVCT